VADGSALAYAKRLADWGEERGWAGTDPYDALNATRLRRPFDVHPLGRRVLLQLVKRSPLDLRPLLGVPPGVNALTLAWVVSAYAVRPELGDEARLRRRLDDLRSMRCGGYDEPCWGYHFPFQSRVLAYGPGDPNTIATTYAGQALLDAHERTGDAELLEEARGTGLFFLAHVPQTGDGDEAYFGYAVGDRSPVHNSSMHVAALLARLSTHGGGDAEAFRAAATRALRWTLARQRPDGSWPYGERPNTAWIDGFHTGYLLDALRLCADAGLDDRADAAYWRGLDFYERELFLADGTPKYTTRSVFPIDSQCVAQAIQTFAWASALQPARIEPARRVLAFAQRRMRRRDGLPIFQRRRWWANRAPHPRWVVAPTLLALAHLLSAEERLSRSLSPAAGARAGAGPAAS
jgi:hypothetical protein